MRPRAKIALAGGILLAGMLAALLFRRDAPPKESIATETASPVHRSAVESLPPAPAAGARSQPRLLGRIDEVPGDASDVRTSSMPEGVAATDQEKPAGESPRADERDEKPRAVEHEARVTSQPLRTHKIVDGDTLYYLAERYLGNGERYLDIFEANRDVLVDPEILMIGRVLKIPPRDAPPARPAPSDAAEAAPLAPMTPIPPGSLRRDSQPVEDSRRDGATRDIAPRPSTPPNALPPEMPVAPPSTLAGDAAWSPRPSDWSPRVSGPGPENAPVDSVEREDPPGEGPAPMPRTYRVRANDTLVGIAREVYGDARRYLDIYSANRQRLRAPDDLREGLILVLP